MPMNLSGRSYLKLLDFTPAEIRYLIRLSRRFKELKLTGTPPEGMPNKVTSSTPRFSIIWCAMCAIMCEICSLPAIDSIERLLPRLSVRSVKGYCRHLSIDLPTSHEKLRSETAPLAPRTFYNGVLPADKR